MFLSHLEGHYYQPQGFQIVILQTQGGLGSAALVVEAYSAAEVILRLGLPLGPTTASGSPKTPKNWLH